MAITLDAKKLVQNNISITVKIKNYRQFRTRLFIAEQLIKLADITLWGCVNTDNDDPDKAVKWFSDNGIVISAAYGAVGDKGTRWSVDCLNIKTRETFELPFAANSFNHCIEIAKTEAKKRKWFNE